MCASFSLYTHTYLPLSLPAFEPQILLHILERKKNEKKESLKNISGRQNYYKLAFCYLGKFYKLWSSEYVIKLFWDSANMLFIRWNLNESTNTKIENLNDENLAFKGCVAKNKKSRKNGSYWFYSLLRCWMSSPSICCLGTHSAAKTRNVLPGFSTFDAGRISSK